VTFWSSIGLAARKPATNRVRRLARRTSSVATSSIGSTIRRFRKRNVTWNSSYERPTCARKCAARTFIIGGRAGRL